MGKGWLGRVKWGQELFRICVKKDKCREGGLRGMVDGSRSKHTIGSFPSQLKSCMEKCKISKHLNGPQGHNNRDYSTHMYFQQFSMMLLF